MKRHLNLYVTGFLLFITALPAYAQLTSSFTTNVSAGCSPLLVYFTNTSAGAPTSYLWTFGNGNTSTLQNPSASYINPGTYQVTLKVTKGASTSTSSKTITIYANPTAEFTPARLGGCTNEQYCFLDKSVKGSGNITQWAWDFGDGNNSNQQNPCNNYVFNDTFTVALVVTDANGCKNTIIKKSFLTVTKPHNVDFALTNASACLPPLKVDFADSTKPANAGYTYAWTFGDSKSSTAKNPSNTYTTGGTFPVTLKVTAPNGCVQSKTKTGAVNIYDPKAAFSATPVTGCAPLEVTMQNTSLPAAGVTYRWQTSNSLGSTQQNPKFTFLTPGQYTIKLKVSIGSCADSIEKTNYITVNPKPSNSASASSSAFCDVPAIVNFNSFLTNTSGVLWQFGDAANSTSTIQKPTFTYNNFGTYTVKMISTGTTGCKDTMTVTTIKVVQSDFDIMIDKKDGCKPLTSELSTQDRGSVVAFTGWSWFVDGIPAGNTQKINYTFNDSGVYAIKCVGTNPEGCIVTKYDTVRVGVHTFPKFDVNKRVACFGQASFVFDNQTNTTTPKALQFYWQFGSKQGNSKNEHPIYNYNDTGVFTVTLISIYKGCMDTLIKYDYIKITGPAAIIDLPVPKCSNDSLQFSDKSKGGNKWEWDFGDGRTSTDRNPKHKYPGSGKYNIHFKVTDTITGCVDVIDTALTIPKAPVLGFRQSDTAGCPGTKIIFTDTSVYDPGTVKTWVWAFGNGKGGNGRGADIVFGGSGFFHATITVTDNFGCSFSLKKDSAVHIYKGNADFSVNKMAGCVPLTLQTSDNSTSDFPIITRKWFWGNGDSTVGPSPSVPYTYNNPPSNQNKGFDLNLVIVDLKGCNYGTGKVVKPSKAKPNFIFSTTKFCGADSVLYTASTSDTNGMAPLRFVWDLAHGYTSTAATVSKGYFAGDTSYKITLILTDSNSCVDSISKIVSVNTKKPRVGFTATPQRIDCPGPPVFFSDTTVRGASPVTKWEWTFGDNGKSILQNPSKTYLVPASYDISLKITDSLGCTDSVYKSGYILIRGPIGSYSFTPKKGCLPLDVEFTATSPNAKRFEMDLADGEIDSLAIDTHTYGRAGIYIPNLTLTDSAGCKRGLPPSDTIVVYALPLPDFSPSRVVVCKDNSVVLTNQTFHDTTIVFYKWKIGMFDSTNAKGPIVHVFDSAGSFKISLFVTDILGCSNYIEKDSLVAVVDDSIPPAVPVMLRSTVLDNQSVLTEFIRNTESDFSEYNLLYNYVLGNATARLNKFDIADTTFTQSALNTLENVYSYAISATDVCLNESDTSVVHTTVELKATGVINAIRLDWTPYKGWDSIQRYEVHRLNDDRSAFVFLASVDSDILTYTDTTTVCFRDFYYRIKAVQKGGHEQESWSDTSGSQPVFVTLIPSTQNVRATVIENKNVLLQWRKREHHLPFTTLIYRSVDSGAAVFYKELSRTDSFLVDKNVDVQKHSYTYTTYLRDNCGGVSVASNTSNTILLKVDLKENDILVYNPEINWNSYHFWKSGIDHYTVDFKYDSLSDFTEVSSQAPADLRFFHKYVSNNQREYCYKITAYQKDSMFIFSESNISCVSTAPRLYAPNVFTINHDGLNDKFDLGGVFLDAYHITIYNRYGEQVFESSDIHDSWDGTNKGQLCPTDVYIYLAEGIGRSGQRIELKGNVTLLR